jgi:hypothetical protein
MRRVLIYFSFNEVGTRQSIASFTKAVMITKSALPDNHFLLEVYTELSEGLITKTHKKDL